MVYFNVNIDEKLVEKIDLLLCGALKWENAYKMDILW